MFPSTAKPVRRTRWNTDRAPPERVRPRRKDRVDGALEGVFSRERHWSRSLTSVGDPQSSSGSFQSRLDTTQVRPTSPADDSPPWPSSPAGSTFRVDSAEPGLAGTMSEELSAAVYGDDPGPTSLFDVGADRRPERWHDSRSFRAATAPVGQPGVSLFESSAMLAGTVPTRGLRAVPGLPPQEREPPKAGSLTGAAVHTSSSSAASLLDSTGRSDSAPRQHYSSASGSASAQLSSSAPPSAVAGGAAPGLRFAPREAKPSPAPLKSPAQRSVRPQSQQQAPPESLQSLPSLSDFSRSALEPGSAPSGAAYASGIGGGLGDTSLMSTGSVGGLGFGGPGGAAALAGTALGPHGTFATAADGSLSHVADAIGFVPASPSDAGATGKAADLPRRDAQRPWASFKSKAKKAEEASVAGAALLAARSEALRAVLAEKYAMSLSTRQSHPAVVAWLHRPNVRRGALTAEQVADIVAGDQAAAVRRLRDLERCLASVGASPTAIDKMHVLGPPPYRVSDALAREFAFTGCATLPTRGVDVAEAERLTTAEAVAACIAADEDEREHRAEQLRLALEAYGLDEAARAVDPAAGATRNRDPLGILPSASGPVDVIGGAARAVASRMERLPPGAARIAGTSPAVTAALAADLAGGGSLGTPLAGTRPLASPQPRGDGASALALPATVTELAAHRAVARSQQRRPGASMSRSGKSQRAPAAGLVAAAVTAAAPAPPASPFASRRVGPTVTGRPTSSPSPARAPPAEHVRGITSFDLLMADAAVEGGEGHGRRSTTPRRLEPLPGLPSTKGEAEAARREALRRALQEDAEPSKVPVASPGPRGLPAQAVVARDAAEVFVNSGLLGGLPATANDVAAMLARLKNDEKERREALAQALAREETARDSRGLLLRLPLIEQWCAAARNLVVEGVGVDDEPLPRDDAYDATIVPWIRKQRPRSRGEERAAREPMGVELALGVTNHGRVVVTFTLPPVQVGEVAPPPGYDARRELDDKLRATGYDAALDATQSDAGRDADGAGGNAFGVQTLRAGASPLPRSSPLKPAGKRQPLERGRRVKEPEPPPTPRLPEAVLDAAARVAAYVADQAERRHALSTAFAKVRPKVPALGVGRFERLRATPEFAQAQALVESFLARGAVDVSLCVRGAPRAVLDDAVSVAEAVANEVRLRCERRQMLQEAAEAHVEGGEDLLRACDSADVTRFLLHRWDSAQGFVQRQVAVRRDRWRRRVELADLMERYGMGALVPRVAVPPVDDPAYVDLASEAAAREGGVDGLEERLRRLPVVRGVQSAVAASWVLRGDAYVHGVWGVPLRDAAEALDAVLLEYEVTAVAEGDDA